MGEDNLCENLAYYGLIGLDGGLAEYAVVDIDNIFFMDDYTDDKLTLIEPLLISLNAYFTLKRFKQGRKHSTQKVLILGAGMLGVSLAIVWNILSPEDSVYINDLYNSRLGKASELFWQSDIFVNTISKEKLKNNYYDIVIDTAGIEPLSVKPAFLEGLKYLRRGGIILTLGMYYNSVEIPFTEFFVNHKNFLNNAFYSKSVIPELTYILNRINFDFDNVSEKVKLDEVLTKGIYKLQLDKDYFLRLEVEC
jgi:threonine dehydrogenase-like Zn-dependent dehydrogenase